MNVNRLLAPTSRRSVLVTSGAIGEGKTPIAINLAEAYARAGKKVMLLDADLYRPTLHTRLKLNNRKGLSDILAENLDWREVAQESQGMVVITSGHHPDGSAAQFESEEMTELLRQFQQEVDIIIIDGPPLLMVDSQAISIQVGGVLLVVRQANTSLASVRTMLEQLKLMGVNVLGVVLNRVPPSHKYYYEGNGYSSNRHDEGMEDEEQETKNHRD